MPIWDELSEAIESGVVVTNPQGYCIYSNAFARSLLPPDPLETPMGSHFTEENLQDLFCGEHLPSEGRHLTAHLKNAEELHLFVKSRPSGGAVVFLQPGRAELSKVLQREERFRALVEISPDAICMLNERLDIIYANSSMTALLGLAEHQILNLNLWQLVNPEDQAFLLRLMNALPDMEEVLPATEQNWHTPGGEPLEVEVVCRSWLESDSRERITVLIARDIRARKAAERQLRESEARHRTMLNAIPDTVFLIDHQGVCRDVHSPAPELLAAPVQSLLGQRIFDLFMPELAELFEHVIAKALETGELQTVEYTLELEGKMQFFEARVMRHSKQDVLAVVRDITDHKAYLERLEYLNQYDQLTGLHNRAHLQENAEQLILTSEPHQVVGVMLWDVNRFKDINDSLGFATGDELLQAVARRLRRHIAHPDVLGRLDGDEFAMVLRRSSIAELMQVAYTVQQGFEKPLKFGGQRHVLSLAMGLAIYPQQGQTYHDLLREANSALRYAKINRQGIAVYRPEFDFPSSERMLMEQELRDAIQSRNLQLEYQPLWDIQRHKLWGVECLVRLKNRDGGFIPPEDFIELAEETGLIRKLDQHVIEKAMGELQGTDFVCSVNLSPSTLRDSEFFGWMQEFAAQLGPRAAQLQIEVTEGTLMQERDVVVGRLEDLRKLGIKVALDDFGVGYSSMSYLKHLPLNVLKLDRSFTTHLVGSETDNRLMDSLIQLGHGLGFQVIAEGVETLEQVEWLKAHHCDFIQGYHISRPLGQHALHLWMETLR